MATEPGKKVLAAFEARKREEDQARQARCRADALAWAQSTLQRMMEEIRSGHRFCLMSLAGERLSLVETARLTALGESLGISLVDHVDIENCGGEYLAIIQSESLCDLIRIGHE